MVICPVALLVLFVDDDHPDVLKWGKHRRAGADHHLGFAVDDLSPLVVPLAFGEAGVEHRHLLL